MVKRFHKHNPNECVFLFFYFISYKLNALILGVELCHALKPTL